ncbi:uncharacterized protein DUF397 [Streptomyces sp. Amel2xB2]|uniref:DUF397 domain-containing protein n=1 Tax=Streptomyces sp. Amel2xB2 TaxID=1305829 RepID=UPI000DBA055D|nr:DUF397 domain-containing protein [Streptomyces sp. Amel2xB2]RAJ58932.1 uncharacterized protein DUF397 [Streptomyces sp. Amel2xB2]
MTEEQHAPSTQLHWVKSSYSDSEGANCVEVAWRKSSYSDNEGGNCVEVAQATSLVHIRDSKDPQGPSLTVPRSGWTRFLQYATVR